MTFEDIFGEPEKPKPRRAPDVHPLPRSCLRCKHLLKDRESWEIPHPEYYVCLGRGGVDNLKSFPFRRTTCSKFEPEPREWVWAH